MDQMRNDGVKVGSGKHVVVGQPADRVHADVEGKRLMIDEDEFGPAEYGVAEGVLLGRGFHPDRRGLHIVA